MNGKYQVGSGRIVTVTHDTPFITNSIPQTEEKSTPSGEKSSDKIHHSKKATSEYSLSSEEKNKR